MKKFSRQIINLKETPNKLPKVGEMVLIYVDEKHIKGWYVGYYCEYKRGESGWRVKSFYINDRDTVHVDVTHWCNLPPTQNNQELKYPSNWY